MIYVDIPLSRHTRPLPFYLATEEYLAHHGTPGQEYFFMWQVPPTVICGRNQDIDLEVDVDYCRTHGIDICRRKSGGGAVIADMNNIMFSHISLRRDTAHHIPTTFSRYTNAVAEFLRTLGLNAHATQRNDILIDQAKVSGYAFFHLPEAAIVHGTMLFDTDRQLMARVLTPSRAKLASKGVTSTASRVTTIRQALPHLTISEFKQKARQALCGHTPALTLSQNAIETIERDYLPHYLKDQWLRIGHSPSAKSHRIEGVGEFRLQATATHGHISTLTLSGDFFLLADLDQRLLKPLIGASTQPEQLLQTIQTLNPSDVVMGLTPVQLRDMITQSLNTCNSK